MTKISWFEKQKNRIVKKYKGDNETIRACLINIGYSPKEINKIIYNLTT